MGAFSAGDSWAFMGDAEIEKFIARWSKSGGAERANYQAFLYELCDVLEVLRLGTPNCDGGRINIGMRVVVAKR